MAAAAVLVMAVIVPSGRAQAQVGAAERLLEQVRWLSDEARAGRLPGETGHDQVRDHLIDAFHALRLQTSGADGDYAQPLTVPLGQGRTAVAANVIGVLAGRSSQLKDEIVVVSAHYDHLGLGEHSRLAADRGSVHPGADDNASGVAVLLGVAAALADTALPRTVVFAAFTGEEQGAVGSRFYVADAQGAIPGRIVANINLDMVGRLNGKPVQVLSTATSPDWPLVIEVASRDSEVPARALAGGGGGSDQQSFIARSIPAVQVFTGGHDDYHRSSDTVDRIDAEGLAAIERFVVALTRELAARDETLRPGVFEQAAPPSDPASPRRSSFGVMPDFNHVGPGVRIEAITSPDVPAAHAGLHPGDIIMTIAGRSVMDLRDYAQILRELTPDNPVSVCLTRGNQTLEVTLSPKRTE